MLDAEAIASDAPGWRVQCHAEVTSTSDLAREAGQRDEPGMTAIFAEAQTAGRGQRGNLWLTPAGQDLMFSVLLRPEQSLEHWPRFTTLAALAVCTAIEETLPLKPQIKWPNDVYLGPRKVSGLLAETFASREGPFLVLGIGVNVNALSFDPALNDSATSLRRELPGTPLLPREPIAAALLRSLQRELARNDDSFPAAVADVRTRSLLIGKSIRAIVEGQPVHGRVIDLNYEGHLILELPDGSQRPLTSAAEVRPV